MPIISQRITIMSLRRPQERNLNDQLQWLAASLGLFNLRDRNRSCFRLFIELLKSAKARRPLTSDELADLLGLSRGTVIHHMHRLIESGLVIQDRNRYLLRVDNLQELIDEIEKDALRALADLRSVASHIDAKLGR